MLLVLVCPAFLLLEILSTILRVKNQNLSVVKGEVEEIKDEKEERETELEILEIEEIIEELTIELRNGRHDHHPEQSKDIGKGMETQQVIEDSVQDNRVE